ncbi:hypothetical protein DFS34DRAFT_653794 [Phlyctochytrium arcticum]|nr:hypothetical protein DFS34DRAFT_653794 [Phlyctochytrium arcticum]
MSLQTSDFRVVASSSRPEASTQENKVIPATAAETTLTKLLNGWNTDPSFQLVVMPQTGNYVMKTTRMSAVTRVLEEKMDWHGLVHWLDEQPNIFRHRLV